MVIASCGILMDTLRQHELLSADQLAELPQLTQGRCGNVRPLAKSLIQRGWLSVYQVNQLLKGHGRDLAIGPYRVVEKLGQGGLSTVYKARHHEHGYLVAIKMIRPEVFASAEGRTQFLQEVEAMAQLEHPNIVQFCDADRWQDTYYFAMEYVDGTDLGKVVRLSGALSVCEACEFIRQAAHGLQHAYERNLVHRDIKPVNLFLTYDFAGANKPPVAKTGSMKATIQLKPLIKILDWGLASPRCPKGAAPPAPIASAGIIGTADYLSPEQARNANSVDIRGDIYSLGCSFYYLLTGQAPFPDGSLMQKLLQHQQDEPRPIEQFRADVPPELTAMVRRMMAKRPDDRFQTPASVALSLLPFTRRGPVAAAANAVPPALKSNPNTQRDDTPMPPDRGNLAPSDFAALARSAPRLPNADDTSGPR